MKKFIYGFCGGITIGLILSIITSLLINNGNYYPTSPATALGKYYFENFNVVQILIFSVIIWALIGLIGSYSGFIYDNLSTRDSIKAASIKHYLIMILTFLPLSIIAGWYDINIMMIIFVVFTYTLIYYFIYITIKNKAMKEIEEINNTIKDNK